MKKLSQVLFANAIFSGLSGVSIVCFESDFMGLFEIHEGHVFSLIGAGLILFSGWLIYLSRQKMVGKRNVQIVVLMDWSWVVACIGIAVFNPFNISMVGIAIMLFSTVIVSIFAILQKRRLNQLKE